MATKRRTKRPTASAYCPTCGYLVGGYHCSCRPKRVRKSSVERLVQKLRKYGYHIGDGWLFTRHRPGHWQRAAGAWAWSIRWQPAGEIGSPDSVRRLLKAKGFCDGVYNEIYVDDHAK